MRFSPKHLRPNIVRCIVSYHDQLWMSGNGTGAYMYDASLKRAATMLKENPEVSIKAISDKMGFSTPRYFGRIFKKKYQMSPLEYRRRMTNTDYKEEGLDEEE